MLAKKENRILQIDSAEKEALKADGYDIVEFDEKTNEYKVVENATGGKTYSVAQYNELKSQLENLIDQNKKLKKENAELKKSAEAVNEKAKG